MILKESMFQLLSNKQQIQYPITISNASCIFMCTPNAGAAKILR